MGSTQREIISGLVTWFASLSAAQQEWFRFGEADAVVRAYLREISGSGLAKKVGEDASLYPKSRHPKGLFSLVSEVGGICRHGPLIIRRHIKTQKK